MSNQINEGTVRIPQRFRMPTEKLSTAAKKGHMALYDGYVDAYGRLVARNDSSMRPDYGPQSEHRSMKIDMAFNMNAAYLHELYFANISDVGSEVYTDSPSYMMISRDFGTFDDWQEDFLACAMDTRDGWACLVYSFYADRLINMVIDSHHLHVPMGCIPIIVLDVWAHSYWRDYLDDKQAYIVAMMQELRWPIIDERIVRAKEVMAIMRRDGGMK